MANDSNVNFPVGRAMQQLTVKVKLTGVDMLVLRIKLGVWLFKFAGWVIGCKVEIEGPQ